MKNLREVIKGNKELYATESFYDAKGIKEDRLNSFTEKAVDIVMQDDADKVAMVGRYIMGNNKAYTAIIKDVVESASDEDIKDMIHCVVKKDASLNTNDELIIHTWRHHELATANPALVITEREGGDTSPVNIDAYGWVARTLNFTKDNE